MPATLRLGSIGPEVKPLQEFLNLLPTALVRHLCSLGDQGGERAGGHLEKGIRHQ